MGIQINPDEMPRYEVFEIYRHGQAEKIGLTPRETQILKLLPYGLSNKQIALHLDISEPTVKVHMKSMTRTMGFKNRGQVAVWAVINGHVKPDPKTYPHVPVAEQD